MSEVKSVLADWLCEKPLGDGSVARAALAIITVSICNAAIG